MYAHSLSQGQKPELQAKRPAACGECDITASRRGPLGDSAPLRSIKRKLQLQDRMLHEGSIYPSGPELKY